MSRMIAATWKQTWTLRLRVNAGSRHEQVVVRWDVLTDVLSLAAIARQPGVVAGTPEA